MLGINNIKHTFTNFAVPNNPQPSKTDVYNGSKETNKRLGWVWTWQTQFIDSKSQSSFH